MGEKCKHVTKAGRGITRQKACSVCQWLVCSATRNWVCENLQCSPGLLSPLFLAVSGRSRPHTDTRLGLGVPSSLPDSEKYSNLNPVHYFSV